MTTAPVTAALEIDAIEVLESVSDGFFACDREFRFLYVNGAAERQLARSRDELVGRGLYDVFPELAAPGGIDEATLRECARTGERIGREYYSPVAGRWFRGSIHPRKWGWALYFHDISARRRANEALRESEERFRVLVEAMAQAVWEADAAGSLSSYSPSWGTLTGQQLDQWRGDGWLDAVHPDDREPTRRRWFEAIERHAPFELEYRIVAADHSVRWSNDHAAPLLGPDGTVRKWVGMNVDITERRSAEEALREVDRRKDEFLAILAHELRNPLAPLRTGIEIMRMGRVEPERIERVRAMMGRQVDHMVALVDDLMDVSRISSGRIVLERRPVELATVIRGALESCDPSIRQKRHEVSLTLPAEAVWVDGDLHRLTQAIGNLLTNAAKYMEPNGHVFVTLERDGNEAVVCVKDTGVGIPPAMLDKIFDLFAQVDSATDRLQGGLGIGLTIVRQLVELHGGSVEARSDGMGRGSEFVVRLPLSSTAQAELDVPQLSETCVHPRQILVVDDNVDAAQAMATMLELLGHEVDVAYDGDQALRLAERVHPEVVLMDLGMPNVNGYVAAHRMRQADWGRDLLLVAITGWGQQADRAASEQAGFDHHLVKPVELDAVQALVAQLDSR